MSKFIAMSRQTIGLDKTRVLLETRIQEVKEESKKWAGVAAQAKEKTTELHPKTTPMPIPSLLKDETVTLKQSL